jgi:Maltokinase N-terminal cap domain
MAIIHRTTLTPGKLELLADWLPDQPWYRRGRGPELAKAGGFRLDDPAGEVGIEFMVVTDGSGDSAVSYLTPLTYRASALAGADGALVGTTEHGVLGRRWVYDGLADQVLVGQLVALLQGRAQPQAQSVSGTADPTVTCVPVADGASLAVESAVAADGPFGTELRVDTVRAENTVAEDNTVGEDGAPGGRLVITVNRVLRPDAAGLADDAGGEAERGRLLAGWRLADGTAVRGCFAAARYTPTSA